jgi:hypothetical protein
MTPVTARDRAAHILGDELLIVLDLNGLQAIDAARLREAMAHLGAAIAQTIPTDDMVIANHVRSALDELRGAL